MRGLKWLSCLGVLALVLATDQGVKRLVLAALPLGSQTSALGGLIVFAPVRQTGLVFGLLGGLDPQWALGLLGAGVAAALLLLLPVLWRAPSSDLFSGVAVGLILGGAGSNVLDRLQLGAVIEYARLELLSLLPIPQFNLADCAILAGMALLLLDWVAAGAGAHGPSHGSAE